MSELPRTEALPRSEEGHDPATVDAARVEEAFATMGRGEVLRSVVMIDGTPA